MPGIVTHLAFAEKVFPERDKDKLVDFLTGTILPDIDFIGVVGRDQTHLPPGKNSLEEVSARFSYPQSKNYSLYLGFLYHSFLDNKFGKSVYAPDDSPISMWAARLLADQILWYKLENLDNLLKRINSIPRSDMLKGVFRADVENWYRVLAAYLRKRPNENTRRDLADEFGIDLKFMRDIEDELKRLERDKSVVGGIEGVYSRTTWELKAST